MSCTNRLHSMARVAAFTGLTLGALDARAAQAQAWTLPNAAEARYGLGTVACHAGPHGGSCLALSCRSKRRVLVSAAGGGGPLEGPVRVSAGQAAFDVTFTFDPKGIDVLGIATSWAEVTAAQAEALLSASTLALTPREPGGDSLRFPTRRLAELGRRAWRTCG